MPVNLKSTVRLLQGRPGSSQTLILHLGTYVTNRMYIKQLSTEGCYTMITIQILHMYIVRNPFCLLKAGVRLMFFVMVMEHIGSVSDIECCMFETDVSSYQHH